MARTTEHGLIWRTRLDLSVWLVKLASKINPRGYVKLGQYQDDEAGA